MSGAMSIATASEGVSGTVPSRGDIGLSAAASADALDASDWRRISLAEINRSPVPWLAGADKLPLAGVSAAAVGAWCTNADALH
jgi:hypothetical protein